MNRLTIITATHQRPQKFKNICLQALLSQTNKQFEWIIINDGQCAETKAIVKAVQASNKLTIQYFETEHQGLIAARNLALDHATAPLISFLDDDNALAPDFVERVLLFFDANPMVSMCNPVRRQRRDVYKEGKRIKTGKVFFKPALDASNIDFIVNDPKAWFDSNGFVHRKNDAVRFNPNVLIMSDYEYMLQLFSYWGLGSLQILEEELILYIQTNDGIIGKSSFKDWLNDMTYIGDNRSQYAIFDAVSSEPWLDEQIDALKQKVQQKQSLPGFPKQ